MLGGGPWDFKSSHRGQGPTVIKSSLTMAGVVCATLILIIEALLQPDFLWAVPDGELRDRTCGDTAVPTLFPRLLLRALGHTSSQQVLDLAAAVGAAGPR